MLSDRWIGALFAAAALAVGALVPSAAGAALPGAHDTTFGSHGFAFAGLDRDARGSVQERWADGEAIVRQPGGRLVAAVTLRYLSFSSSTTRVGLAAMTPSGRVDTSFGTRGTVETNVSGGNERAIALMRQSNGRLVLVGTSRGRMLFVRYTAAGKLDRGFGAHGSVIFSPGAGTDMANAVRPRASGRILVAGQSGRLAALVQLRSDGSLDRGFGKSGKVLLDVGSGSDRLTGVQVDGQGRIVVVGTAGLTGIVARLSATGVLDRHFGSRGIARVPEAGGRALVLDSRGRAVFAGANYHDRRPDFNGRPLTNGIAMARLTSSGKLDSTYGSAGVRRLPVLTTGGTTVGPPRALVLDASGRALVSGNAGGCASVARLTAAGALDTTFGPGDPTRVELPQYPIGYYCPSASQILEPSIPGPDGGVSTFSGLLLQPDRRIVVVGTMGPDEAQGGPDVVFARYFD